MGLKNLSKILHVERGSVSLKFSDTSVIEYSTSLFNELKKTLDDIRESSWPDRGFSLNLTDSERINEGGKKLIFNIVDYIIKNNSINADVWVSSKPSAVVKEIVKQIKEKQRATNDRSIRVRVNYKTRINKFLLANWVCGLTFVILGSTKLVEAATIKTKWFEGVNSVQLIGGVMVLVSLLPYTIKYIKLLKAKGEA